MPADAAVRMVIDADALAVRDGLRRLMGAPPLSGLSEDARGTAEIVLAEVLNNIVEHAYARWPGTIDLTIRDDPGGVLLRVEDDGLPMPGEALPPGTPPDPGALPDGGFGWHLILRLSLAADYRRVAGRNRLTLSLPGGLGASAAP